MKKVSSSRRYDDEQEKANAAEFKVIYRCCVLP
jgi:hypothetical protein